MRLYAYLLLATLALAARAATIPDNAATLEKKLDPVSQEKDKASENVASEQELVDITNIINDEDNKLRVKPAEIPVEVVVQKVEPILKSSEESEEIVRPIVDLRNPGPPQRQEHETQNPAFYAAEQQVVQTYKQNLNDAQVVLRQGFQGVSESIQNIFQNNEQIQAIQDSIKKLQENFLAQINKLNGTIQNYLNGNNANEVSPAGQQTKAEYQVVETGLKNLQNDFAKGVQSLADGIGGFASLRADGETPGTSTGTAPAPVNPPPAGPGNFLLDLINRFQTTVQGNLNNFTQTVNNVVAQGQNFFQGGNTNPPAAVPAGAQSDTPVTAAPAPANPWLNFPNPFNILTNTQTQTQNTQNQQTPGAFGSGNGPIVQAFQNLQNQFTQIFQPGGQTPAAATQPAQPSVPVKPVEPVPAPTEEKPIAQPAKPEEQTKSVIPETPKDEKVEESVVEPVTDVKTKGHIHFGHHGHHEGAGDNNDSGKRVKASEPEKEMVKESVSQEVVPEQGKKEEVTVQKTEEVVDKTE